MTPPAPADMDAMDYVQHLANGEAALMLLECVLVLLIENELVDKEAIVQSIETAVATKRQMAEDGIHPLVATTAAGTLARIANSIASARIR